MKSAIASCTLSLLFLWGGERAVRAGSYPKIERSTFTRAIVCARCHLDIYNRWRDSLHARAVDDPIFTAAYLEAYKATGGEAKYYCLRCHAPTTYITKDYEMKLEITREGVTCDFCHTVSAVDLSDPAHPFTIEVGPVKRGPMRRSSSPAHGVKYSSLHETSELCAACHELRNEKGVSIMSTYSEWRRSPYPEKGMQCQHCHMPLREGAVVLPEIKEKASSSINEHNLAGGHSLEMLRRAVKLKVHKVERRGNKLIVRVDLTNAGSGHMIPTGLPTRKLVLSVEVRTSRAGTSTAQRVYQKRVVDEYSLEIPRDSLIKTLGGRVSMDNRLAPLETRRERFVFTVPEGVGAVVRAYVFYLYRPMLLEKKEMKITLTEEIKAVQR
ncbi:MAG: multiheme c-type cytochrome [Nitrospinota bacterium]